MIRRYNTLCHRVSTSHFRILFLQFRLYNNLWIHINSSSVNINSSSTYILSSVVNPLTDFHRSLKPYVWRLTFREFPLICCSSFREPTFRPYRLRFTLVPFRGLLLQSYCFPPLPFQYVLEHLVSVQKFEQVLCFYSKKKILRYKITQ